MQFANEQFIRMMNEQRERYLEQKIKRVFAGQDIMVSLTEDEMNMYEEN